MSGLAGLDLKIINAITANLPVSDLTRAELRNFLQGRVTTASNIEEFTDGLDRLVSEIELGSTEPVGSATGEIFGALEGGAVVALEGGIVVAKGMEIAQELGHLRQHNRAEQDAMNRVRDQIQRDVDRGVIHGGQGNPSRDIDDLIRQEERQRQRARQKSGEEKKGDITFRDPSIQRGRPVDDGSGDVKQPDVEEGLGIDIDIKQADDADLERFFRDPGQFQEIEAEQQQALINRAFQDAEQAVREGRASPGILDRLADIRAAGLVGVTGYAGVRTFMEIWRNIRRGGGGNVPITGGGTTGGGTTGGGTTGGGTTGGGTTGGGTTGGGTTGGGTTGGGTTGGGTTGGGGAPPFVKPTPVDPTENIDTPAGDPLLRPSFYNVGTDFFDRMYDTPMSVQNSEWAEFDFVSLIDRNNGIEVDNVLSQKIRFQAPLYYPKVQKPLAPPSRESVLLSKIPMKREIQLSQPYMPKFDNADMGRPMDFTTTYNHSPFDFNFLNLKLYNPV